MDNYLNLSAIKLRDKIKANEININDLSEFYLNYSKKINRKYKAFKKINHKNIKEQYKNLK